MIEVKYMLIAKFAEITGYTRRAIETKIQNGVWIEGKHYRRAPDGHITMCLTEYNKWVESSKG